ncbi:hypothetical protein [Pseudoduganella sp. OTU4001]|uniref:hypothetical protein n=1 Tax=Pseudoduganella sp. OTU4001 TaxID=3043854 RepID=UPI00313E299D
MSLINKMLQDLDARGGDGARSSASSVVRPVGAASRGGLSPAVIGAGVVALAVLGGGGFAAYKYFRGGTQPAPMPVPAAGPQAAKPAIQQARGPVAASDADDGAPVVEGGIPPEQQRAAGEKLARKMEERNAAARRAATERAASAPPADKLQAAAGKRESVHALAPARAKAPTHIADVAQGAAQRGPATASGQAPIAAHARAQGDAAATAPAKARGQAKASAPGAKVAAGEGVEAGLSSQQKAENEYRRALASLQDARIIEAIAGLEQAVYLYPRHEAARQTLVSLLIEGGRTAEAIRHMTFATSLDPRQANMAMLLARLQLEHGGNALDTLQRSLPYAESNADYRALLAGVMQRHNRHKEAADHYQAAVRLQPGNAVWWMGMGISLQADKRNAEAKIAFQRARDIGRLTPELQSFVERRLQQLN